MRAHFIAAMITGLASLHCGGAETSATTTGEQAAPSKATQPATAPEPVPELVQVEVTQLRTSSDLIVELVGNQARLVAPNHTGAPLDFARRAPDDEHLREELFASAQELFAEAVSSSERGEVRVRLDAGTVASDFVDLLYTMGRIGVLSYELEIATSEGPRVLLLNRPQTCRRELSERRCVNVHLRVTEQGTLVSALMMDPSAWCDIAPEASGSLESIAGRAITPASGSCPGWPFLAPGDESLDQLLAKLGELGELCRTSEVSVEDSVTAANFIPPIAALQAANQHVVFRAGGRASCAAEPRAPISIDAIAGG